MAGDITRIKRRDGEVKPIFAPFIIACEVVVFHALLKSHSIIAHTAALREARLAKLQMIWK